MAHSVKSVMLSYHARVLQFRNRRREAPDEPLLRNFYMKAGERF